MIVALPLEKALDALARTLVQRSCHCLELQFQGIWCPAGFPESWACKCCIYIHASLLAFINPFFFFASTFFPVALPWAIHRSGDSMTWVLFIVLWPIATTSILKVTNLIASGLWVGSISFSTLEPRIRSALPVRVQSPLYF